jgi:RNA polymerase sigma factor (sigma-70 family)
MTEKQQMVYELHYIEGYTLSEIAAIMGTSVPSVHKHKEKILKFIKENFKRG